jgi:hypothetical protein
MKKILVVALAIILALVPVATANALSPGDFLIDPIYQVEVPDISLIYPFDPLILTPSMGLDFSIIPIGAVIDSLYTNDLFYINAQMITPPEDLSDPYVGIHSGGIITFTYRYNKNIVDVALISINSAFSMVGSATYTTINASTGIKEVSFDVSMDEAHFSDDIVGKIIAQVKFEVLEDRYGDSTVVASAWTDEAYHVEQVGTKDIGMGIIIPIIDTVDEDRANYETLAFSVESLEIQLKDSEGALISPAYQVPYPEDNTVDAPELTGYELTSASPLDVFSLYGQRRLLAVFEYEETAELPPVTDVTINCYYDLEPPVIYTKTMAYPSSGYVFAPNLESEGFTLLDTVSYQEVDPGDTVTFRYIDNETGTHAAYINGYPDATVKPEKGITREEMASILYRFIKDPGKASFVRTGARFSDVALSGPVWGGREIEYVASLGLFTGYPDGRFLPKNNITREEFVTVLTRLANYMPSSVPAIPTGNWSQAAVSLAVACGYTEGLSTSPAGENWLSATWRTTPTTRAEVIVMFNNLFNRGMSPASAGSMASPFVDLPISYWAFLDVIEATRNHSFNRNPDGSENHL